jgi:hypothetical protein
MLHAREAGMTNASQCQCQSGVFGGLISRSTGPIANGGFLIIFTCMTLISGSGTANSGPCTAQIAQLQQQIAQTTPGPESGPTAPQSIGAQLHHQPTPGTVQRADHVANADADAALARAQEADASGDAALCNRSLEEATRLYGFD